MFDFRGQGDGVGLDQPNLVGAPVPHDQQSFGVGIRTHLCKCWRLPFDALSYSIRNKDLTLSKIDLVEI